MSLYEFLFVRASLFYLLYTALTGTAFYIWPSLIAYLKITHVHAGLVGFFLSMVMGVAFWMMPRPGQIRQDRLEGIVFYLLNAGLLLRLVTEPWLLYSGNLALKPTLIVSSLLQASAIGVFAFAMSQRVFTKEQLFKLAEERKRKNP